MPRFRYEAVDPAGALRQGVEEAASEAALAARLRRTVGMPIRILPAEGAAPLRASTRGAGRQARPASPGLLAAAPRLTRQDLAMVMRELAVMLAAGQDLDSALRFLVETAPRRRVGAVLATVRDAVRDGTPLPDALAAHPASFPRAAIGMIRAGEASGRLPETLERLASMLERQQRLAATVRSALIYPAVVLVAALGSTGFILGSVLPRFAELFASGNAEMPQSARMLMAVGEAVAAWWMPALLALLLLFLLGRGLSRVPAVRRAADGALLRLPLAGPLVRDVLAARLVRVLGTLLGNGVPLMTALGILREGVENTALLSAVDAATASAREGGSLASALADAGVLPARAVALLRLGERNAQLGPMALRAADMLDEAVQQTTQRLFALLVPAITILMGGLVGTIIASLLQAMLSLNDLAL